MTSVEPAGPVAVVPAGRSRLPDQPPISVTTGRQLLPLHPAESEAVMAILTKTQALGVIRRAYGPDRAESLADHLPERIDLENPADHQLLFRLGLTRERLLEALGAEW